MLCGFALQTTYGMRVGARGQETQSWAEAGFLTSPSLSSVGFCHGDCLRYMSNVAKAAILDALSTWLPPRD